MSHIRWQALLAVLGLIFLGPLLAYLAFSYSTVEQPDFGGIYTEGVAGQPNAINPLFDQYNSTDRDIDSLIFGGLTRADESGVLRPDLAQKYEISPDGLIYTFTLRTNVQWSDGAPLSTDDVLYTIQTIQASDYPGLSYISDLWRTVAITEVNASTVRFQLSEPFAPFLDYTSIGLLPSHLLKDVSATELQQSTFNRHPVGTGPFVLEELTADHATLSPNPRYAGPRPLLGNLVFKFYPNYESLFSAYGRGEVEGISQISPEDIVQARTTKTLALFSARVPGYSLVFLNLDKPQFQQKEVRQALLYAADRQKIIDDVLHGQALLGAGPIMRNSWAFDPAIKQYNYDPTQAEKLLDGAGWVKNADGIRIKGQDVLSFTLVTNDDDPTRAAIAQAVSANWNAIGAHVQVQLLPAASLIQDVLRPRDFDAVLFGFTQLPVDPDPYPLWNSTQTPSQSEAGQNYSGWKNRDADVLLEEARRISDQSRRADLYQRFQTIFMDELPALILYYPVYTYAVDTRIHGVQLSPLLDPTDRFRTVSQWYLKTKRVIVSESQQASGN